MSLIKIFSRQIFVRLTEDQDGFIATVEFPAIRVRMLRLALRMVTRQTLRYRPFLRVRKAFYAADFSAQGSGKVGLVRTPPASEVEKKACAR